MRGFRPGVPRHRRDWHRQDRVSPGPASSGRSFIGVFQRCAYGEAKIAVPTVGSTISARRRWLRGVAGLLDKIRQRGPRVRRSLWTARGIVTLECGKNPSVVMQAAGWFPRTGFRLPRPRMQTHGRHWLWVSCDGQPGLPRVACACGASFDGRLRRRIRFTISGKPCPRAVRRLGDALPSVTTFTPTSVQDEIIQVRVYLR